METDGLADIISLVKAACSKHIVTQPRVMRLPSIYKPSIQIKN
jgi:hypothetical protein